VARRGAVTIRGRNVYVYMLAMEGDLIFSAADGLRAKCGARIVTEDQVRITN